MPIVKDPAAGLVRQAGNGSDHILEALRRGEDIPDRRANLLRLAWDQTMPYAEAERLLPEDEIDDLCDLLDDLRSYGIVHCVHHLQAAQRDGWILSDEDRAWYRRECGLPPEQDWTEADAARLALWRKGIRIADEIEHVAQWLLDARITDDELTARLPSAEHRLVLERVDPQTVTRNDAFLAEADREGWLSADDVWEDLLNDADGQ